MSVETELYLIDAVRLQDEVVPAMADFLDHRDPDAADRLLRETLVGEPFAALHEIDPVLADYFSQGSRDLLDGKLPDEIMDDATGRMTADSERSGGELACSLVRYWCARSPHSTPTGITMNRVPSPITCENGPPKGTFGDRR
jgi:hypothetical protein